MPRLLRDRRPLQTSAGDSHTIFHYVDIVNCDNGNRSLTPRRVDTFVTEKGDPALIVGAGRFSALINGQWVDLYEPQ